VFSHVPHSNQADSELATVGSECGYIAGERCLFNATGLTSN